MKQFINEPFSFNRHEKNYGAIDPQFIQTDDGIKIAFYHMQSHFEPKAKIVFIHGAGAHCHMPDYQEIGEKLAKSGVDCFLMDIRGHGNSEGTRGATKSKTRVWKDIKQLIAYVMNTDKMTPVYLSGHSSGAGTVINYATWEERQECNGYILISPYLGWRAKSYRKSMMEDNFAKAYIPNFVFNILTFGLLFGNKTSVYYNYPQEQQHADPLIVTSITCNMSNSCTLWNPRKQFHLIKKPIALYIGSDDELFDPIKVCSYMEFLNQNTKTTSFFEIIPNMKHLSILTSIDNYLLMAIERFRRTTVST